MRKLARFISIVLSLLLAMSGTVLAEPMPADELNALKRTSDWYTTKQVIGCGSADSGGLTPLEGSENAEKAFNFFIAKGLKPFQAAGILGNMQHESGVQPQRLQGTASGVITPAETLGNRNIGWGIVQWTPASKFISTQSPISKANDIGAQLEFLWAQLEGTGPAAEKKAGDDLKATTTLEQAVLAFQGGPQQTIGGQLVGPYMGYERPANKTASIPQRYSDAKGFLAKYGSGTGSGTPVTSDIFAGVSATGCATISDGSGEVDMATIFQASDAMTCPVGTDGGVQDGYREGTLVKIRICNVPNGVGSTTQVNARIAKNVADLFAAAKNQGVAMGGGGFRTMAGQQQTYNNNCSGGVCSPPTAKPGWSNHQMGLAIDFTWGGGILKTNDSGFNWMKANASQYGLQNLPSEAWHWSVNGG